MGSVKDPDADPVRSALYGRIRIVTEKADPKCMKGSRKKGESQHPLWVGPGTFDLFSIHLLTVSKINITDRPNK